MPVSGSRSSNSAPSLRPESLLELFFHKLSQPLGALSANLELASMSDDPAEHRAAIDKGLVQVERLMWLFNIARTFFAEDFAHNSESFSIEECLNAVIDDCAPLAEAKNVTLQLDLRGTANVLANRRHLQHALENIVNVSLRSVNQGEILGIEGECGEQVQILVPSGVEFSAQSEDLTFHPFPPGTEVKPGQAANLDLALSRRIIQSFAGDIKILEGKAHNRVFQVTLPIPSRPDR